MVASINASTSAGVVTTADTSGILQLQTASTAALTIDANQRTAFVAGTAALPAITTSGDTNTGIFFPAADTIAFSEGGAESMRIDSSGNVMVGATSSSFRLRVQGAVTDVGEGDTNVLQGLISTTAQAAGVGPSLLFVATYDGGSGLAGMGSIAGIKENSTSGNYAGALKFMTRPNGSNLAERMRISSAGVVTAPYQPCFLAYRTTTQSGTSPFTVLFDTVPVNVGSCYDSGTGRFTAPVTGNYHFTFQTLGIVGSWSSFDVFSYKNGGSTPSILSTRPNSTSGSDNASALSTSVGICNLTAGDYIEIKALNTTSIYSDGNAWLKFMGFLIG